MGRRSLSTIAATVIAGVVLFYISRQTRHPQHWDAFGHFASKDSVGMLDISIRTVGNYMDSIRKSYESQDYIGHALTTGKLVQILEGLPPRVHMGCGKRIADAVKSGGFAPYLTIVIEYAYRLSRYPTRGRLATLNQFRREVAETIKKIDKQDNSAVLIRTDRRGSFRAYSSNVGKFVAAFALTKQGYEIIASGAEPEDLVRVVTMAEICREQIENREMRSSEGMRRCKQLGNIVAGAMGETGMAASDVEETMAGLRGGISRGIEACLKEEADATRSELIAEMEARTSCIENKSNDLRRGGDITPWGALLEPSSSPDRMPGGFEYTGTTVDDMITSSQATHHYTNRLTGEQATVAEYVAATGESWATSGEEFGAFVSVSGDDGTTTTLFDEDGTPIASNFEGAGAYEGISSSETYHSNGKVKTRVTRNDNTGETTVQEYDEDGNLINEETSTDPATDGTTSTPVGDWGGSGCQGNLREDLLGSDLGAPGSRVSPYIIPDPDAPVEEIGNECLSGAISDPVGTCEPSVAMCIDPLLGQSDCDCGQATLGSDLEGESSRCLSTNCGPDGQCNPSTGACLSGASGEGVPELWPPVHDIQPSVIPSLPKVPPDGLPVQL